MTKYESSLKQICLQCKTKPQNCNKAKCTRYNNMRELVELHYKQIKVVDKIKEIGMSKKIEIILENLGLLNKPEESESEEINV